jgi:hypothetical protein
MSHYIAGGLMILLLCAAALLGMEAFGVYHSAAMVEAALLDGQLQLAADGGLSPRVEQMVRRRIAAEGGDVSRLQVTGSQPRTPYGELVSLQVVYAYPFALNGLLPRGENGGWQRRGTFRVERTATTMSGWRP